MDLSNRSALPEELDNDQVSAATYGRCAVELAAVNRLTVTHRPTLRWLTRATADLPSGSVLSVLDVACGNGDLLRAIARWAKRRGLKVYLSGVDLNPRSTAAALEATPGWMDIDYRTGDVFFYVPAGRPDFVVSSQFTHHLDDEEVVAFLGWVEEHSRRGWHIVDLHRHPVPYYAFPVLCRLMRWHRIIRDDGLISIARSFRRADWRRYLDEAGLQADIRWGPAFRFCVHRMKG